MNGVEATPWMASCPTSSSTLQQYALVRLLWLSLVRKSDAAEGAGHANASFGEDPTTSSFNMSSSNPCVGRIVCGPAHVPRPIYRGRNGGLYYINESGLSVYVASSEVTMHDAQIAGDELVHAPSISMRARTQFSLSAAGGNMSGYELQMKNFVSNHLTMTSKEVPQLVRGSVMRMSLCGEVGTSEWEPLEVHRSAKAVLILLHCTVWAARLEAALDYVKGVFVGQFNHMIRRCYVVDPPDAIRELIQSWGDLQKEFVMLDSRVPIDVSGESTTKEVASAVAAELLQRHKQCVEAAENESAAGPSTTLDARVQSKHKITRSRWSKLAGDCMLQLGSLDKAFAHYSRTQFSSQTDPLWCAATVQAIAGVRYQQLSPFIQQLRAMSDALVWIQSDSIDWKGTEVQQCLRHLSQTRHVASRSLEVLSQMVAQHYVSQTVRRRLRAEITGCLQDKLSDYDGLMLRAQSCVAAGSNELEADPMAYYVGRDLKNCAEELIRVIFLEVEIYMAEALRQLELAASANPSSRASLRALELDVHLKLLSFIAEKGNKAQFFEQVKKIRTDFAHDIESVEGMYPQFMNFLALQSLHLGCHRLAISFLMDLAARHSAAHEAQRAVECVLRATRASKLHLNLHDLAVYSEQDAIAKALARTTSRYSLDMSKSWLHHETELMSNHSFVLVADLKGCNTANSSAGTLVSSDSSAMIHVRLLKELIQQLGQRSSQRGLRCRAATLLLFRYATHLSSCDQEHLLQLAAADAQFVHFQLLPPTDPLPFITNWEALPLPPHLAPKTVAVGGPVFTFIDTHRLRLTVLSLNGRKLNSGVVWAVGDVGTVVMTLRNPFDQDLHISSLVLQCRSCEELNDDNTLPPPAASYTTGSLAPTSYVLRHVDLRARACIQVQLHVMPQMAGYLLVEGAELRLSNIHAPIPITGRLPVPMGIPVLQRLPLVSCTVSRSELEIFSGQQVEFHVRVVNCGPVPVERIALTAHSEVCLLENCEGCLERRSNAEEATVVLNKAALQEAATSPLQPGEVVFIPVRLQAPAIIPKQESHFVVFRVDCSIPHEPPSMPPNVPHAVPVFGVIPRRVLETRMRLFHAPTIVISSLRCSKDRRFLHIHLVNRSPFYSVALKLSTLAFARLPDAVLVAGADYIVPPIDITTMPKSALPLRVPWLLREPPYCVGELQLEVEVDDEVRVAPLQDGLVCLRFEYTNPVDEYSRVRAMWESKPEASAALEHVLHDEEVGEDEVAATQCIVGRRGSRLLSLVSSLATIPDGEPHHHRHVPPPFIKRCSVEAGSPPLAIEVPLLAPVSIHLVVSAPPSWKPLPVSLRVRVVLEHPFDVGSLSGPVDAAASVGGDVGLIFHGVYELFAFKTGIHTLIVTLSDDEREVSHIIEVSATVPNDE